MKKALISILPLLLLTGLAYAELNIELLGQLYGENDGDRFGHAVTNLADINNDGFEDFAVAAPYYPESTDTGRVYIYFGSESLDLNPDLIIENPGGVKWFGYAIGWVDDINGDGVGEFLAAALDYFWGIVFVYFGGEELDGKPDMVFHEPGVMNFGLCMASGDVNNDGYPDLVFRGVNNGYVYLGSENMDTIPDVVLEAPGFGQNGISIGDVNGDRYGDIVAYGYEDPNIYLTYLYFGRDSLHPEPDLVFPHPGSKPEIGDVNGDSYGDIIAWCRVHYGGEVIDTVYDVWLSKAKHSPTVGRFNTDRYGDIVCNWSTELGYNNSNHIYLGGTEVDTVLDWTRYGGTWWALGYDIAAVDLNLDGVDEFLLAGPFYPDEPIRRGIVQVYTGDTATTSADDFPGTLPGEIYLLQNYPNPFNSSTTIHFSVSSGPPREVSLRVHDVQGHLVKVLFDKPGISGMNRVIWDGTNDLDEKVASGVYFISLKSGDILETRKAILIR